MRDAGPIDAPPVPVSICKVDRFPLTSAALVLRGKEARLAMLTAGSLDFLTRCN